MLGSLGRATLSHSKGLNRVGVSLTTPEDGNRSSFQNVVFSMFRIPNDGQSPETQ
jgi:hypothetical protein